MGLLDGGRRMLGSPWSPLSSGVFGVKRSRQADYGSLLQRMWGQRGLATHSRFTVVENKARQVAAREKIRYRAQVVHEGREPSFEETKEKMKASPGRESMGRDKKKKKRFTRTEIRQAFGELDLLDAEIGDETPGRVKLYKKELLLKGIPEAVPREGKAKTIRQMKAESQIQRKLMTKIYSREMWELDDAVQNVVGSTPFSVEITRVDVSQDLRNISLYWLPPLSHGLYSESVIGDLDTVMRRFKGTFRSIIAGMAQRRFAPYVELKYDKKTAMSFIKKAQLANENEFTMSAYDQKDFNTDMETNLTENIDDGSQSIDHQFQKEIFRKLNML